MPSRSSTAWKARPRWRRSGERVDHASPATGQHRADRRGAGEQRAGLAGSIARHSSRVTSSRVSNAMSSAWPAIIALVAASARPRRAAPPGASASSSTSSASVSSASPAMMASPTPNSAHTVGRCRRSRSPSMMSSCSSEKLCTSSTATAPGTPRRPARRRPRPTAARARAGRPCRRRPAPGAVHVGPAEVVLHRAVQLREQRGRPRRAGPGRHVARPGEHRRRRGDHATTAPVADRAPRRGLRRGTEVGEHGGRRGGAAAHRALHRGRPSGVGPGPGQEQAGHRGASAGPQRGGARARPGTSPRARG